MNKSILKIDLYDSTIGYDPLVGSGKINIKNICLKDFDLLINNHNDNNNKSDQNENKKKDSRASEANKEIEIPIELVSKKGESVGRVVLYVFRKLKSELEKDIKISEDTPFTTEQDMKLKETYHGGILKIRCITAHNLKSVEMMGKQVGDTRRILFLFF